MSASEETIVMRLLTDRSLMKIHWVDDDVLWKALRILAGMIIDAKPIVESDALMMADISRFAPLPPEEQAKHDTTSFPSEVWLEQFERLTKSA